MLPKCSLRALQFYVRQLAFVKVNGRSTMAECKEAEGWPFTAILNSQCTGCALYGNLKIWVR
jgi:hypothetical protein